MDRFRAMQIFTRVVEVRSFSKAAKALTLSPASVTTAIQSLEKLFGVRLLVRTTRQLTVTHAGATYYERCRSILADLEQTEAQLFGVAAEPKGRLRVEITDWIARQLVLPVLRTFQDRFPDVTLQIRMREAAEDSLQERFDCAIYAGPLQDSGFVARRIGVLKSVICAAPAYISRHGEPRHVEELSNHYAVGLFSGRSGRAQPWDFMIDGAAVSIKMNHRLEVNESDRYVDCGLLGLGLIRSPEWQVRRYLQSGRLREVLAQWMCPPAPISVIYPNRGLVSPTLRVFIDWIASVFDGSPLSRQNEMFVVSKTEQLPSVS
jgi:LysR family transcriptional regulator for bpeEF and oprC